MRRGAARRTAIDGVLLAPLLAVCQTTAASADEEPLPRVLPCRPTISCSADIVPPGAIEVEAGYAGRHVRGGGVIHAEPVLFKVTLFPWLQAQVGSSGLLLASGEPSPKLYLFDYVDDFTYGLKVHVADQSEDLPSVAASAALGVPSFEPSDAIPYAYNASFWVYVSKDFGAPGDAGSVHVDLNGGFNVWAFELPARSVQGFAALAVSVALKWHLGVMGEVYGFQDAGLVSPKDAGLLAGLSYSPVPWVMFDLGGDASAFPSTREFTLFSGATFVPVRLWGGAPSTEAQSSRRVRATVPAEMTSGVPDRPSEPPLTALHSPRP